MRVVLQIDMEAAAHNGVPTVVDVSTETGAEPAPVPEIVPEPEAQIPETKMSAAEPADSELLRLAASFGDRLREFEAAVECGGTVSNDAVKAAANRLVSYVDHIRQ